MFFSAYYSFEGDLGRYPWLCSLGTPIEKNNPKTAHSCIQSDVVSEGGGVATRYHRPRKKRGKTNYQEAGPCSDAVSLYSLQYVSSSQQFIHLTLVLFPP